MINLYKCKYDMLQLFLENPIEFSRQSKITINCKKRSEQIMGALYSCMDHVGTAKELPPVWLVINENLEYLGCLFLKEYDEISEIAYGIEKQYQNQGNMTSALQLCCSMLTEEGVIKK